MLLDGFIEFFHQSPYFFLPAVTFSVWLPQVQLTFAPFLVPNPLLAEDAGGVRFFLTTLT